MSARRLFPRTILILIILLSSSYLFSQSIIPSVTVGHAASTSSPLFTTLRYPGANITKPTGINNVGQMVGTFSLPCLPGCGLLTAQGFLYSSGTFFAIRDPNATCTGGYVSSNCHTLPDGINDAGQISGLYTDCSSARGCKGHGFLYSNQTYTTLDYPGAAFTSAWGLNNHGQVVGQGCVGNPSPPPAYTCHDFVYSSGTFTDVQGLNGYNTATSSIEPYAINDAGDIVGEYDDPAGNTHGFLYTSSGSFSVLDGPLCSPSSPGDCVTIAWGINNQGRIVGEYPDSGFNDHGYLYHGGIYTTVDPLGISNKYGSTAFGINDAGDVVGQYWTGSSSTAGFEASHRVQGTVSLDIQGKKSQPLGNVKLDLLQDCSTKCTRGPATFAGSDGNYKIDFPVDVTSGELNITLVDKNGFFEVYYQDTFGSPAYLLTSPIDLSAGNTTANISLSVGPSYVRINGSACSSSCDAGTNVDSRQFAHLAAIYSAMNIFFDWGTHTLGQTFNDKCLPLQVQAFSSYAPSDDAQFEITSGSDPCPASILISPYYSDMASSSRFDIDLEVIAHEFGHFAQWDALNGNLPPVQGTDHMGYANPDSSWSVREGIAHFISALIRHDRYGVQQPDSQGNPDHPMINMSEPIPQPGVLVSSLKDPSRQNYCGFMYESYAEEFSVATLLWSYDQQLHHSASGLWSILTNANPDTINDLAHALLNADPKTATLLEQRYMYNDTSDNNCKYDPGESLGTSQWWILYPQNPPSAPSICVRSVCAPSRTRAFGVINPRENVEVDVVDSTGQPLKDFDLNISLQYQAPYDNYSFTTTTHVDQSPFTLNGVLYLPGLVTFTAQKESVVIGSSNYTFTQFWNAYQASPKVMTGPLMTEKISPPSSTPPTAQEPSTILGLSATELYTLTSVLAIVMIVGVITFSYKRKQKILNPAGQI